LSLVIEYKLRKTFRHFAFEPSFLARHQPLVKLIHVKNSIMNRESRHRRPPSCRASYWSAPLARLAASCRPPVGPPPGPPPLCISRPPHPPPPIPVAAANASHVLRPPAHVLYRRVLRPPPRGAPPRAGLCEVRVGRAAATTWVGFDATVGELYYAAARADPQLAFLAGVWHCRWSPPHARRPARR